MPNIDFTLPHWAYWLGLLLFPIAGMILARRTRQTQKNYSSALAYLILVTGGILGLHRFYLRSLLGLVFIPVFLFVLWSNAAERDARAALSDATNHVRIAERVIEREAPRVEAAEADIAALKAEVEAAEPDSFAKKSAERRLKRAEDAIATGRDRIVAAEEELAEAQPIAVAATDKRAFWANAARYTFYLILAFVALDALLIPGLVRKANEAVALELPEETIIDAETAAKAAQIDPDARKPDHEWAENWIDKLSLYAGEFVSYWAVIAVFVYYFEVISRYVFNSPTNWAHESMYLMFGMQYLIAGSYAMMTEGHVRVDIFYAPMSPRRKAWTDLFTSIFFFIFAGTLLVTSYIFAFDAIAVPSGNSVVSDWARGQIGFGEMLGGLSLRDWTDPAIRWGEISFNEWEVPLWPMKWMMFVGGVLLVLQGVSKLSKDIRVIAKGA
ncbi:TRAP transporter small permease subunit [Albidovulum sediminicola]|uniref:TRAP transporter small permease protein n=1 Tax=Albidovulum sediminicola TaxID=2984331 RepID=A0ABT2Z1M2_9RHOB|nr:TRAP transporter small permease subunit [Defluviimonas sp. WL0075]MCV2865050.1 TRAP transporter small permease subunit [Defluviimonas sp. WL0075]